MESEMYSSSWSPIHNETVPKGKFRSCIAHAVSFGSLDLKIQIKDGTSYQVV